MPLRIACGFLSTIGEEKIVIIIAFDIVKRTLSYSGFKEVTDYGFVADIVGLGKSSNTLKIHVS